MSSTRQHSGFSFSTYSVTIHKFSNTFSVFNQKFNMCHTKTEDEKTKRKENESILFRDALCASSNRKINWMWRYWIGYTNNVKTDGILCGLRMSLFPITCWLLAWCQRFNLSKKVLSVCIQIQVSTSSFTYEIEFCGSNQWQLFQWWK